MNELERKKCLRMFSYGVYVLSSVNKGSYCASTVTWVSQASFEPPLISVCIKRNSASYKVVRESKRFILHILSKDQKDLAASFFKSTLIDGSKINGHSFEILNGMPLINGFPAYLVCDVVEILDSGDHPLFMAEVKNAVVNNEQLPLELSKTGWSYGG